MIEGRPYHTIIDVQCDEDKTPSSIADNTTLARNFLYGSRSVPKSKDLGFNSPVFRYVEELKE